MRRFYFFKFNLDLKMIFRAKKKSAPTKHFKLTWNDVINEGSPTRRISLILRALWRLENSRVVASITLISGIRLVNVVLKGYHDYMTY